MTKKFRLMLILVALMSLLAAACGGDEDEGSGAGADTEQNGSGSGGGTDNTGETGGTGGGTDPVDVTSDEFEPLRVAVVTPSAANDLAFSQSIVEALHRMRDAGLFSEVAVSEGVFVVEDAGVALRDYAEDGYDLVIGHGSQYGALLEQIAPDFPDTAFAWGTAVNTFGLPNVSAYTSASDEGGYAMGLMAAELAAGSQIGIIGPIAVGDAKLYVDGFAAGVAEGGGSSTAVYTESFADVQLAAEAAAAFVGGGSTVLTGTAQMTVGAIGVAADNDVAWFGTQSNQTQVAPEVVVANQVYRWDEVLDELVADLAMGSMGGTAYEINFANGGLVLEYNEDYPLDPAIRAIGDAAAAGLADGSISTGVGEDLPAPEPEMEPLTVAVVTPSAANDLAFSQSIVEALSRMEDAGLFSEVAVSEGIFVVEDAGVALRDYAEDGYDLVIGHGSQYGALLEQIAPDFPDTAFAWGTAVNTFGLPNVSAYTSASDEGGYAMGLMAAELAAGSQVGIIGPIAVGDAKLYVDGFAAGVAEGGGSSTAVYTESFADVQLAAEAAQAFVGAGSTVLTGTAQMTVGAIGVAAANDVAWFGTQSNQTQVAPEVVVANQVYRWDEVLDELVADLAMGSMGGTAYEINFANGGLVLEYNEDYPLDPAIRAIGDAAAAGLADGSVTTGIG